MDLQKDISLKRFALISWCTGFWNRKSINYEVQRTINDPTWPDTRNVIALAKNELKAFNLPNIIYDELIQRITFFGERVFKWYWWCRNTGAPWRCTREIHWTVFGTIDEPKTIAKNFLGPDVTLSGDLEIYGVYYMACTSALKDYINRNANKIIDFCRKDTKEMTCRIKYNPLLYRSVLTLANPESLNLSNKEINELTCKYFGYIGCSKEAYMFQSSVENGYTAAAEYYWQQLNPSEKDDKLMNAVVKWIQNYTLDIDVLVFLLSVMSEGQRETYFGYIVKQHVNKLRNRSKCYFILQAFIESCAWENHFFPVFYLLEDLKEHDEEYYYDVFERIINAWKTRLAVGLDAKNTVYKQMFLTVWGKLKKFHSENHRYRSFFVGNIFKLFDIDVFNIVLEKYSFRQDFLELGGTYFKNLLFENRFDLLKEFMATVLISPGERAWFKSELMSNLEDVLRVCKFNVADNLLNFLSASKEERQRMKFKFDFLSLCAEYFVNKVFKRATELITWGFSNEQEKDQYINSIASSDLDWLYMIWSLNKNNWATSLSDFLQIFFDTKDEYVGRKIAKLLTEDALRKFYIKISHIYWINCSLTRKAFQTLDELMAFCLPLEDGPNLKMKIAENAGKWLLHLAQKNLCWGSVDVFLNWVLGYEIKGFDEKEMILDLEKKREFLKRFLLSANGIEFLEIISTPRYIIHFRSYACLLVDWAGGVNVIESYMNKLEASSIHDPNFNFKYASLKDMLQSFKNGDVQYKTGEHVCYYKGT